MKKIIEIMVSKPKLSTIIIYLMIMISTPQLWSQSLLANPSFEILDPGVNSFSGWDQMGEVSSTENAWHGNLAAKASGVTSGEWNVSGYWQNLDCATSEQWEISGVVMNSSAAAISGESVALVYIEWYDASNQQIDYQSFTVADNFTPLDEYIQFDLLSSPAPAGTVSTHLLIGILQSPNEPAAEIIFDQITFYSTSSPTIDDVQWVDFPDGRTIEFADYSWRVKGTGWYGPGPSNFSHTPECVWIDEFERLHMTIKNIDNTWYSTEVTLEDVLGYGDYIFTTRGDLEQLDVHSVLGLFIWQYNVSYDPAQNWWNPYNEIDVEFSYWGNPGNEIGQFVAQPWDWEGNLVRFDAEFEEDELTSHAFNWQPELVEFRSWRGGPQDESPANMIFQWAYTGPHNPRPEQPRVHINLWQFAGPPATEQEVIIEEFTFNSANTASDPDHITEAAGSLQNYPNPFNPETTIRFTLNDDYLEPELVIFNIRGQKIESVALAKNQTSYKWKAEQLASGIYFYQLRSNGIILDTKRMLLLK